MNIISELKTLTVKELRALIKNYKGVSMSVRDIIMVRIIENEIANRKANHEYI